MRPPSQSDNPGWRQSRIGFAAFHGLALVGVYSLLRLGLFIGFGPATASVSAGDAVLTFLIGMHLDLLVALTLGVGLFGPIHSYEIPWLIVGPAFVKAPSRVDTLGCSLDVAPTLLGILGRPYETLFFGHDLLKNPGAGGRVLLNHNRDIGLYESEKLVVLGLNKTAEHYSGDPKSGEMSPQLQPCDADLETEKNATALFQVADDLYIHKRYRLDK